MRLDGKVAIVTGGVQGLGGAHTEALIAYGANVVVADIRDDEGATFAGCLNARAGSKRVHYVHLDVRDFAEWERAVAAAESEFGRLTTLVNNAGFPGRTGIEETTEEGWSHTIDVDLKGTWLGMKACVPAFRRAGGGAVVNTSSCYAVVSSGRGSAAYCSAKAGVLMLSKGAAVEYAKQNIRINCVIPGVVDTPRNRTLCRRSGRGICCATRRWAAWRGPRRSRTPSCFLPPTPPRSSPAHPWSLTAASRRFSDPPASAPVARWSHGLQQALLQYRQSFRIVRRKAGRAGRVGVCLDDAVAGRSVRSF